MKNTVTLFLVILFTNFGVSQEFQYNVFNAARRSIDKTALRDAKSLIDIDSTYKAAWVNFYISVEMYVTVDGKEIKSVGKNDKITLEQSKLLSKADAWSDIKAVVTYNPKNSLNEPNDVRKVDFKMKVLPDHQASFVGGNEKLLQYLKSKIGKNITIAPDALKEYADLTFIINEEGKVIGVDWTQKSGNEEVDKLMYETICSMPQWVPSKDIDGTKYSQQFRFTFGAKGQGCYLGNYSIN